MQKNLTEPTWKLALKEEFNKPYMKELEAFLSQEEQEEKANAHKNRGWEKFTDKIIEIVNDECENVVFILWGAYAQKKSKFIDEAKHLVIKEPHPSPLSAYRGFWGSKPFSKVNGYLEEHQKDVIDWQLA